MQETGLKKLQNNNIWKIKHE